VPALGKPYAAEVALRVTTSSLALKIRRWRVNAFDPVVMRDAAALICAITALIHAIWPNGIFR
jgi:hypothetical protein